MALAFNTESDLFAAFILLPVFIAICLAVAMEPVAQGLAANARSTCGCSTIGLDSQSPCPECGKPQTCEPRRRFRLRENATEAIYTAFICYVGTFLCAMPLVYGSTLLSYMLDGVEASQAMRAIPNREFYDYSLPGSAPLMFFVVLINPFLLRYERPKLAPRLIVLFTCIAAVLTCIYHIQSAGFRR